MLNPNGYAHIIDPNAPGGESKHDVVTCIECGHIDMVRPGLGQPLSVMIFRTDGTHYFKECGFCRSCMQPVCPRCDGKPCNNRFRRIDAEEKQAWRQMICQQV